MRRDDQHHKIDKGLVEAARVVGYVAFGISIISVILAIIPCVGGFMVFPGILCLIVSVFAAIGSAQHEMKKGIFIGGSIISGIVVIIGFVQIAVFDSAMDKMDEGMKPVEKQIIQDALQQIDTTGSTYIDEDNQLRIDSVPVGEVEGL